jgi:hypothetical protein
VVGKCSDGDIDHDGDIVSPGWMASAVKEWLATYPAVRLQHRSDYPAGRGLEAWTDDQGSTFVKSLIVDDQAKRMVRKGVLRAYSVGIADPQTRQSVKARRWEIYGGRLAEVSLVDSPSNARCGIRVVDKSADGTPRYLGKAFVVGDSHRSVLKGCECEPCQAARKACGCPECAGTRKTLKKSAKAAAEHGRVLEKALESALRGSMASSLVSADPWTREMAYRALRGDYGQG